MAQLANQGSNVAQGGNASASQNVVGGNRVTVSAFYGAGATNNSATLDLMSSKNGSKGDPIKTNYSRIYFDTGNGVLDWQLDIAKRLLAQTGAFNDLLKTCFGNTAYDIYFIAMDGLGIVNEEGFYIGGTSGQTSTPYTFEEWNRSIGKIGMYTPETRNRIDKTFSDGRRPIFIHYDIRYLQSLNTEFLKMTKKGPQYSTKYCNLMEDFLFTLSHEIHAHVINLMKGLSKSNRTEHGLYNHDHIESDGSPPYNETPEIGKSGASQDKRDVIRIVNSLRNK